MSEKANVTLLDFARDERSSNSSIKNDDATVEGGPRFTAASAMNAAQTDKEQTVRQSLYNHSSAIFWSLLVSLLVIMEGEHALTIAWKSLTLERL